MFISSSLSMFQGPLPHLAQVSISAESLASHAGSFWGFFTNSILVSGIVTGLILWFVRTAMAKRELIPGGRQNLVEMLVEALYKQVEGIVGRHIAPKAFPLLASIFIFILTANWFGLVPGVGTFGLGPKDGFLSIAAHHAGQAAPHAAAGHDAAPSAYHEFVPLLRPPTSDLNMTLALALIFMVFWAWLTFKEAGLWHFLKHTFGVKGEAKGLFGVFLAFAFFGVGIIEIVSIAIRPVSLSFRLFGNIFAGENLMHAMSNLGDQLHFSPVPAFLLKCVLPIPFFFMELLVGMVQALVFMLLCAVYINLSTAHEEEAHH